MAVTHNLKLQHIINTVATQMGVSVDEISQNTRRSNAKMKVAKELVCLLSKKYLQHDIKNSEITASLGYVDKHKMASQVRRNVITANSKVNGVQKDEYFIWLLSTIEAQLMGKFTKPYNVNDTWKGKIEWVLSTSFNPLRMCDICDKIVQQEPIFQNRFDTVHYAVAKELSKNKALFIGEVTDDRRYRLNV